MTIYEVPLTPEAQTFTILLGATRYKLTLAWREASEGGWVLDVASEDGTLLLSGVPLVTGADLFAQYSYLRLGGELRVQTDSDHNAVPTFDNLGIGSHLYFLTS